MLHEVSNCEICLLFEVDCRLLYEVERWAGINNNKLSIIDMGCLKLEKVNRRLS